MLCVCIIVVISLCIKLIGNNRSGQKVLELGYFQHLFHLAFLFYPESLYLLRLVGRNIVFNRVESKVIHLVGSLRAYLLCKLIHCRMRCRAKHSFRQFVVSNRNSESLYFVIQ